MKLRLLISTALVAASIFVGAAPAQAAACPPEEGPCCNQPPGNALYKKLTGEDLIHCPW